MQVLLLHILQIIAIAVLLLAVLDFTFTVNHLVLSYDDDNMMMMITGVSENLCWSTFPTIDALVSLKLMKQNVIIMVMMIEVIGMMIVMITVMILFSRRA